MNRITTFWPGNAAAWAEMLKNVFTVLAAIVGGVWVLWKYRLYRESHSKIEFAVDCRYVATIENEYVLELFANYRNAGQVTQRIRDWTFDVHLCNDSRDFKVHEESGQRHRCNRVDLKTKFIIKGKFISENFLIDGQTAQEFTYLIKVPVTTKLIDLYSIFYFGSTKDFQTARRTFAIEKLMQ